MKVRKSRTSSINLLISDMYTEFFVYLIKLIKGNSVNLNTRKLLSIVKVIGSDLLCSKTYGHNKDKKGIVNNMAIKKDLCLYNCNYNF